MTTTNTTPSTTNLTGVPFVGMPATILGWSDRYPATVITVSKSGRVVTVQEDTATRVDSNGMSDCQDYTYAPNPNGSIRAYSLRNNGKWVEVGTKDSCVCLGSRRKYHDYSF